MGNVKVTFKNVQGDIREYWKIRNDHNRGSHKGEWTLSDEIIHVEGYGIPKLEYDGTVARERWDVPRLEKLLWYKNCLTLRSDFGNIHVSTLLKKVNEIIKDEKSKCGLPMEEIYLMEIRVENEFKQLNGITR